MSDGTVPRRCQNLAPIACDLSVLSPEQREERGRLEAELRRAVVGVIELSDGYAILLDRRSAIAGRPEEFVRLEQACCPFLTFTIAMGDPEGGALRLEITGAEGAKEFLVSQLGITRTE